MILKFMNQKSTKIYNYKQIADGIDYKNPRQRELVIQSLHKLLSEERIKETEKGKYIINLKIEGTLTGIIDFNQAGNAYVKVDELDDDVFILAACRVETEDGSCGQPVFFDDFGEHGFGVGK